MTTPTMPNEYPSDTLFAESSAPASVDVIHELIMAGVTADVTMSARAEHGRDWWPLTIPMVSAGVVPNWPDVVARPTNESQVRAVVRVAAHHGVPITAQGGRSGVVGGAAAPTGRSHWI